MGKMELSLNKELALGYKSKSQQVRIMTEDWVLRNAFCPGCGHKSLSEFENNKPVADFFCENCNEEFELKSKAGIFSNKITGGAYATMVERINADNSPNFFFLTYSEDLDVTNFLIIPKQFFTEDIILKRPPLKATAKRAGWIGCNIDLSKVPNAGKVFLVKDSRVVAPNLVQQTYNKTLFIRSKSKEARGWILDVLACIEEIPTDSFTLMDVYKFENRLQERYPNNNFIKDKIRQQLQFLRDRGLIVFVKRGQYQKVM